jgi:putative transposase
VQQMIRRSDPQGKNKRKISRKSTQEMLLLQHYRFKQRLISRVKVSNRNRLIIVNESYTSKTCTWCGYEHAKLGGSKMFNCPECHNKIPRDINGARNIYIKHVNVENIPLDDPTPHLSYGKSLVRLSNGNS